jgi:PAS domain S-box-containing protein
MGDNQFYQGKMEPLRHGRGDEINFLSFFHSSPDLLFVFDPEGLILEANNTVKEKLDYSIEELIGKSIFHLHPVELRNDAENFLREILSGERSYCPLPFVSKSGKLLYVETKISKGTWNGNEVIYSISKDVTERLRAEEAARDIEERYKILFNNINDVIFVHEFSGGLTGRFLEVNDIACERLGYTREELLEMSPRDIDAPEGYALVPEMMTKLERDKHIVWEGVHMTKNGKRIPVEISNHLFVLEGKPVILATVRDITERKRAEELLRRSEGKYRKIFENVQDIFYQSDINGKIVEISPSIERYSGYKPEELIGMQIENVYQNPADRGELLNILSRKGEIEDYILKLKTKDQREVYVSANVHILTGPDGNPIGVEGSLRDVSERILSEEKLKASEQLLRKQNEEYAALNEELKKSNEQILLINSQFKIAKEKAEESDRLKSAFLANMSHEIRTPMNGIMGFSSMLADSSLQNDVRDAYVKIVNSSCDQLLHIVNDIIDISKIEAGQIDLSQTSFELKELFDEVISLYSPSAKEKGINLILEAFPEILSGRQKMLSDRTKLRQVLENLLSNAVKFTHSGKIVVRCGLKDDYLKVDVEDTGIGIKADLQSVVFERFRQVETSYTKKYGGTGLGLSITKAYIEKMGGKIWVRSELGIGSTFSFILPYRFSSTFEQEPREVPKKSQLSGDMTVLIVEDEEINWLYLHEILKKSVKTLNAVTGAQAIEYVKRHPEIQIVLMDIKLPDINGLELTKIIKQINNKITVIAQTAFALSGDREKALEAGCSDYITKPVRREDLLNLISLYSGK